MEKLADTLNLEETHGAYDAYCYTLSQAPRAYRRALAAYRCVKTRHPWNQVLTVSPRDGEINNGFTPVNLVLYSSRGVFNKRSYELIIPAFEKEGIIYVDNIEEVAYLRTSSSHRRESGYVYVYPITVKAALSPLFDALTFMAEVSAAKEGVVEKAYDYQGWLYAGEYTQSVEELVDWYLEHNASRFAQEAKEQSESSYWAFTSNTQDEDQQEKMLVLGERLRELNPAPWSSGVEFPESELPESLYDALVKVSHRDTHIMLDSMAVTDEGEYLSSDIRSVMRDPKGVEVFTLPTIKVAEFTLDDNVWKKTTIRFKFFNDVGGVEAVVFRGERVFDLPDQLAKGVLRAILVKKGVQQACSAGLVTLDEKDNSAVPLNERELSYEKYLSLGTEWINGLLKEAQPRPEDLLPHPDEDPESSEPLAEWERILLEGGA